MKIKFVQIAVDRGFVVALDENGRVWRYQSEAERGYAYWKLLADETERTYPSEEE
jgi:NADPH-dependent 2,4-dienoyl-CoA reductase/sulfur reductase-like enzyme